MWCLLRLRPSLPVAAAAPQACPHGRTTGSSGCSRAAGGSGTRGATASTPPGAAGAGACCTAWTRTRVRGAGGADVPAAGLLYAPFCGPPACHALPLRGCGDLLAPARPAAGWVNSVRLVPGSERLVSGGSEGALHAWSFGGELLLSGREHAQAIWCCEAGADRCPPGLATPSRATAAVALAAAFTGFLPCAGRQMWRPLSNGLPQQLPN